MSNITKKDNNEIIAETDLINTLNQLASLAADSVKAYAENAPKLTNITNKIIEVLDDEELIAMMENKDLLNLLTTTTKYQLQPLEQFTKLFTQMNQFQERLETVKEAEKFKELSQELSKAAQEAGRDIEDEIITVDEFIKDINS